jgi:hypothetical protein
MPSQIETHVAQLRHIERLQMTQPSKYAMQDTRRENVRRYVNDNGGPSAVAKRLGHSNGSYLVQMIGPNPSRPVTEKNARAFEALLGLDEGYFDRAIAPLPVVALPPTPPTPADRTTADDLVKVIDAVMAACKDEQVDLTTAKFAEVLSLVAKNAQNAQNADADQYAHTLVRLLK